ADAPGAAGRTRGPRAADTRARGAPFATCAPAMNELAEDSEAVADTSTQNGASPPSARQRRVLPRGGEVARPPADGHPGGSSPGIDARVRDVRPPEPPEPAPARAEHAHPPLPAATVRSAERPKPLLRRPRRVLLAALALGIVADFDFDGPHPAA